MEGRAIWIMNLIRFAIWLEECPVLGDDVELSVAPRWRVASPLAVSKMSQSTEMRKS